MLYQGLLLAVCVAVSHQSSYSAGGYGINAAQLYQGKYTGRCDADGFYFKDSASFVMCSNGNAYEHRCAPGSRNSDYSSYSKGFRGFCNVNLVDFGYTLKHGGYGSQNTGYGHQSTGYGHQTSGHRNTGYGNNNAGYGQHTTHYGNSKAPHGNKNSGYGHQSQSHGHQNDGYGTHSSGYGHQTSGYGNQHAGRGFGGFGFGRGLGGLGGKPHNQGYGYIESYQRYVAPAQTRYH